MKGLVLTYVLTVFGALAGLRYPLIGLLVYVGFAVLKPQAIFGFAGDISNISLIVGIGMLIGWTANGFGTWQFGRGRAIVVMALLFAAWFMLSATQALSTSPASRAVEQFAKTLLPFLVGVTTMTELRHCRWMLWTIVLSVGYVGFELNLDYLVKGYNSAAVGFGGADNNFLGLTLVTVIGPAVALAISSKHWLQRLLAAAATALILHSTLLTFSRGAMLGLLAVGAAAFAAMPKRPKHIAALILVLLVAARLTGPELAARYSTTFASEEDRDGSAESRIELWKDCLLVVREYPVLGVGPWNWAVVVANYGWPAGKSAHSVWMETAAETGFPGVFFLAGFFGLTILRLRPLARAHQTDENRDEATLAIGVILSLVGFSVTGQFVSATNPEIAFYVAMIGVALLKVKAQNVAAAERALSFTPVRPPIAATALRS